MTATNIFLPSFGNRPECLVGRDEIIADFLDGLGQPIGHPMRTSILIGQRGAGKTALLLEFAELAGQHDCVVARVTANRQMLDEIVQLIQLNGSAYVPKRRTSVSSVSAGALGFSLGLSFSDATEKNYGFRVKLSLLCDELAKHGKKVLILVDEVQANTDEVRDLATTFQHLVGEKKDIAIVMAGLPSALSSVLNDQILTFLNRAHKIRLGPLPLPEVSIYYARAFAQSGKDIDSGILEAAAKATRGYPYLLQLIGYYIIRYTNSVGSDIISGAVVREALVLAKGAMAEGIFEPALKGLSEKDRDFLDAMAEDGTNAKVADISARLKVSQAYVQKYRIRLIAAGVIGASSRGRVEFLIPYLDEYLRGEW
jgi:type II secretory pathway predicted ATPase ExeA